MNKITALSVLVILLASCTKAPVEVQLAPEAKETVTFFAMGDQGTGDFRQKMVARLLEKQCLADGEVNFTLLLGDNFYQDGVDSVDDPLWNDYFEAMYDGPCLMGMPFYAMAGNHDHRKNSDALLEYSAKSLGSGRWRMPGFYYTEDFGKVAGQVLLRVFVIDTSLNMSEQWDKIKQATDGDGRAIWHLVASHYPTRSYDYKHQDFDVMVKYLAPVMQQAGIDLQISGHAHNMQMIRVENEPLYVISGAGGKEYYPLSEAEKPYMLYGHEGLGFVKIVADAEVMAIEFIPVWPGEPAVFRVDRECRDTRGASACLAESAK